MATTFQPMNLTGFDPTFGLGQLQGLGLQDNAPSFPSANIGGTGVSADSAGGMFDGLFSRNSMFGGEQADGTMSGGWVSPLASIGGAIYGGIQGNKQLKLAQDQFKEGKRQFDQNFQAQRTTTNTQIEDRQRARVASNPGAYESVDSYVKRNSV